jgi:hypothetical protein
VGSLDGGVFIKGSGKKPPDFWIDVGKFQIGAMMSV